MILIQMGLIHKMFGRLLHIAGIGQPAIQCCDGLAQRCNVTLQHRPLFIFIDRIYQPAQPLFLTFERERDCIAWAIAVAYEVASTCQRR